MKRRFLPIRLIRVICGCLGVPDHRERIARARRATRRPRSRLVKKPQSPGYGGSAAPRAMSANRAPPGGAHYERPRRFALQHRPAERPIHLAFESSIAMLIVSACLHGTEPAPKANTIIRN